MKSKETKKGYQNRESVQKLSEISSSKITIGPAIWNHITNVYYWHNNSLKQTLKTLGQFL